MVARWPTPQDYQEAIQNPGTAFDDPELRTGEAERDALGLPKPRGGAFATVYKFKSGGRQWAVRCFLRQVNDQDDRYQAISDALERAKLPYTVPFAYVPNGVRVQKTWYPILQMEWVQGEPLDKYVSKNLNSPERLIALARDWVTMLRDLEVAGIAHGDLQHGNVLVRDGVIKLVDYDGMFVPSLKGRGSNETGHRNYQHPGRTASDFDGRLDAFSGWVVYVSLIALSLQPELWAQFHGGDECLLFRRADFDDPVASKLFKTLEDHPEGTLGDLARLLHRLTYEPLSRIPVLDGGSIQITLPKSIVETSPSQKASPGWLDDHVTRHANQVQKPAVAAAAEPQQIEASWIFDFLRPTNPDPVPQFHGGFLGQRLTAIASILSVLATPVSAGWLVTMLVLGIACLVTGGTWWLGYWREAANIRARTLRVELATAQRMAAVARQALIPINQKMQAGRQCLSAETAEQNRRIAVIASSEQAELTSIASRYQSQLADIRRRKTDVKFREDTETHRLKNGLGNQFALLQQRIASSPSEEKSELDKLLNEFQEQYVRSRLSTIDMSEEIMEGVGHVLKGKLRAVGVRTAADISYASVLRAPGVGKTRADQLVRWHDILAAKARRSAPQKLPSHEEDAIRVRYRVQRTYWELERDKLQRQLKDAEAAMRTRFGDERHTLETTEIAISKAWKTEETGVASRHNTDRLRVTAEGASRRSQIQAEIDSARLSLEQADRELSSAQWKQSKLERDSRRFEEVTFVAYVSIVIFLRRLRNGMEI